MCLGIPGRILEIPADQPDLGRVDVEGVVREINLVLLADDPPAPGDWVLIHLGFALNRMTEDEVAEAQSTRVLIHGGPGALGDPDPDPAAPSPIGGRAT
jgi:hydrogenase expression/formation protein HypC